MLKQTAAVLFADDDPLKLYYDGRSHSVQRDDEGYILDIELPFGQKGNIDVVKRGDELTSTDWRVSSQYRFANGPGSALTGHCAA